MLFLLFVAQIKNYYRQKAKSYEEFLLRDSKHNGHLYVA